MYNPKSDGGWLLEKLQNKPKTGIYFIAGHGSDNPRIEKKIPKGCKYCTFTTDPRFFHIEQ